METVLVMRDNSIINFASQAIYLDEFDNIIETYPEKIIFLKDTDSTYRNSNTNYAQHYGLETIDELIGLSDLNLNPRHDKLYLNDDQLVIKTRQPKNIYNPAHYPALGDIFVEGYLAPVLNRNNRIAGIVGVLDIRNNVFGGSFLSVLNFLQRNNIAHYLKQKQFIVQPYNILLSKNELVCYFYFSLLNFTSKQIAELLHLSPRTVEKYIERVREKKIDLPEQVFVNSIQNLVLHHLS